MLSPSQGRSMTECPKCGLVKTVKNGCHLGRQRHRCKGCGFQFTRATPKGRSASEKTTAVLLYTLGFSLNSIARTLKVSTPAVVRWVRLFAEKIYENRNLVRQLSSNWTRCGSICVQKNKLWKAYCRDTGSSLTGICGDRREPSPN